MNQSWHPEDSDWRENSEDGNAVTAPSIVLERLFAMPTISPLKNGDVMPREPHLVLTCSAYDDDEDDEE
jgi:hypothetical protein